MNRIVTLIKGYFKLPIGVCFLGKPDNGKRISILEISTVCLDGAHLRDPFGICDAETGYETMVFMDGSTLFHVYKCNYESQKEAEDGHSHVVNGILAGTVPLAIPIYYFATEVKPK